MGSRFWGSRILGFWVYGLELRIWVLGLRVGWWLQGGSLGGDKAT